jgi:hypothetical protein
MSCTDNGLNRTLHNPQKIATMSKIVLLSIPRNYIWFGFVNVSCICASTVYNVNVVYTGGVFECFF